MELNRSFLMSLIEVLLETALSTPKASPFTKMILVTELIFLIKGSLNCGFSPRIRLAIYCLNEAPLESSMLYLHMSIRTLIEACLTLGFLC